MTPSLPAHTPSCAIAVIAKAPRPGHVKTRLQGVLTPEESAAMGAAFLRDTLANLALAATMAPIAPVIAYAPAGQESRFDGMVGPEVQLLLADGSHGEAPGVVGFGRVLLEVTRMLLAQGHAAVCVLGADSPTVPTGQLVRAAQMLLQNRTDAVLGAAEDGGYWLLGLTAPRPEPFAHISWSTTAVAGETRAAVAGAGLSLAELECWYDVDDAAALDRLVREIDHPGEAFPAPHTAALVRSLRLPARLAERAA